MPRKMKLGSFNRQSNHLEVIRGLTDDELKNHAAYSPVCVEARNRLKLFRLLNRNYEDWKNYLATLLNASSNEEDIGDELNRLLLNYLTFAYSIQEHFEVSFGRRFKKHPAKKEEYKEFLDRLCKMCWPFAFILDFRGYVQHVGLGIGRYNRHVNDVSVVIEVVADAEDLINDSRQWKRSRLTKERGEIELIPVLKEFHIQMIQNYGKYVAHVFFPELKDAASFYQSLTSEAKSNDPAAQMVFFEDDPKVSPQEGGKSSIRVDLVFPPNDLFSELGIMVKT